MIRPPGFPGVAFSTASDGDLRGNASDRASVSVRLGVDEDWATVTQVHGSTVVLALEAGDQGQADAIFTTEPGLPVAVLTADCLGVALIAEGAVGVAHAGWRGIAAGVVPALIESMREAGRPPVGAAIGPGIGPCCYEVGPEVVAEIPQSAATTTWDTESVDLVRAVRSQLEGLEVWESGECTLCGEGLHSHRRNRTPERMATIAWIT
jgi:YfiH family protein